MQEVEIETKTKEKREDQQLSNDQKVGLENINRQKEEFILDYTINVIDRDQTSRRKAVCGKVLKSVVNQLNFVNY